MAVYSHQNSVWEAATDVVLAELGGHSFLKGGYRHFLVEVAELQCPHCAVYHANCYATPWFTVLLGFFYTWGGTCLLLHLSTPLIEEPHCALHQSTLLWIYQHWSIKFITLR